MKLFGLKHPQQSIRLRSRSAAARRRGRVVVVALTLCGAISVFSSPQIQELALDIQMAVCAGADMFAQAMAIRDGENHIFLSSLIEPR